MDHFGLMEFPRERIIAEQLRINVEPGDVVLFVGESGSGKSTAMRRLSSQLEDVLPLEQIALADRPVIELFEEDWASALRLLTSCGLGEAQLLLHRPRELSDGQRWRLQLALALSRHSRGETSHPRWLCADEFTATLDRTLAKVVAFHVARLCRSRGLGLLVATTHEDIAADLAADVEIRMHVDGAAEVRYADQRGVKKKTTASASKMNSGPAPVPNPTGRTSRAGITAPTASGACDSSVCCGIATNPSASAC